MKVTDGTRVCEVEENNGLWIVVDGGRRRLTYLGGGRYVEATWKLWKEVK